MIFPHFLKAAYRHLHVLHHDHGIRCLYPLLRPLHSPLPRPLCSPRPRYPFVINKRESLSESEGAPFVLGSRLGRFRLPNPRGSALHP